MIKAIPTIYNCQQYRSKLEAQYAKGMDEANIKFIYEPEGFEFSDGTKYLPDFYLPEYDTFIEVKGVMTEKDEHKIEMLRKESGKRVVVAGGDDILLKIVCPTVHDVAFNTAWFNAENMLNGSVDEDKYIKCKTCEIDDGFENFKILYLREDYKENPKDTKKLNKYNDSKLWIIDDLSENYDAFFMVCPKCGKKTLHCNHDGWSCGWCGHYDGDNFERLNLDDYKNEEIIISPSYIDYRGGKVDA